MARDGLLYVCDTEGWTLCLIPASRSGVRLTVPQDVYAMVLCPEAPFASLRQLEIPQQVQGVSIDASDEVLAALTSQLTIYGWRIPLRSALRCKTGLPLSAWRPRRRLRRPSNLRRRPRRRPGEIADVPALVHQLYSSFSSAMRMPRALHSGRRRSVKAGGRLHRWWAHLPPATSTAACAPTIRRI